MTAAKMLAVLAVVLFAVAFVLFAFTDGNAKAVEDFTLGGFVALALAHAL